MARQPQLWQVIFILIVGVIAVSTAAIFIRLAIAAAGVRGVGFSLVVAALRLAIASIILLPAWRSLYLVPPVRAAWLYAIAAGVVLAIHFATWITSLSYTSIAASTTLVTTNPVWVALLSWVWFREKPSPFTKVGIGLAILGGSAIALGGDPTTGGSNPMLGNSLALIGAWAASLYFLLGREAQRAGASITGYITIAYSCAALVLLPLPFAASTAYTGYPPLVYGYIALMAVCSQIIGHTSCNWAVRWISPTFVTLAILFEPVSASFLGYWIFQEVPSLWVLIGAIGILMGVAIAALGTQTSDSS